MKNVKKLFAFVAAAGAVSLLSATALNASAAVTAPVTTTTTTTTTTETTTTEETTTTAAPRVKDAPPFEAVMNIQAGSDQQWEGNYENVATITGNGSYSVSYTFASAQDTIDLLLIDTDIDAYAFAPADSTAPIKDGTLKLTVDRVELVRSTGESEPITYLGPSEDAVTLGSDGSSLQLNLLYTWNGVDARDIASALPGGGAAVGDQIKVTFSVAGLPGETTAATTTSYTTTTSVITYYDYGNGGSSYSPSYGSGSTYSVPYNSNVSQTADPGVIAIAVGATAAAAAAIGAATAKKRKRNKRK